MIRGETIAAIATAPGRGGVAIVRVSGPDAFAVGRVLTGREMTPGRIRFARIAGVDEGVVLAFAAPHSYTGEDVVEFQGHGGAVAPRRVLRAAIAAGARLAHRGEFTQRAFLNGRLGYDQAESVLDLVDAKTERAAAAAFEGLQGRKERALRALYEQALDLSTEAEHTIDIDEGELPEGFVRDLQARIAALDAALEGEIRRAAEGRILREGALVVLAGPPNAGKSSLMNALLGERRAIVSDVPGTTRDSIEEWLDVEGWPVRLVDTAGLRATGDAIEREGVERAEELIARADLVLALGGGTVTGAARVLTVHAKCDLGRGEGLNVSAKTGEGLEDLRRAIAAELEAAAASAGEGAADDAAVAGLVEARTLLAGADAADLVLAANALRRVAERLGALVGATYSSDLLDRLFSRFCVGK